MSSLPALPPLPAEATHLATRVSTLAERVAALTITSAEDFATAARLRAQLTTDLDDLALIFDPIVESAHAAWKTALGQRGAFTKPAEEAKRVLGRLMADYEHGVAKRRQEAEAAARLEQRRLEEAERARVEAERAQRQAAIDAQRLDEAEQAAEQGDLARAQRLLETTPVAEAAAPAPVFVPPPVVEPVPTAAGVSFRTEWDFRITRPDLVPLEFRSIDESRIRRVVKAMQQHTKIPGVEVFEKRVAVTAPRR